MNRQTHKKTLAQRRAARVAAGVGALALIAVTASIGSGAAADQARSQVSPPAITGATVNAAEDQEPTDSDAFEVKVGKSVTVTADVTGAYEAAGVYASTDVDGEGGETVVVPLGPNRKTNQSSVEPLNVEGEDIVYDITNRVGEVQQLVAGGGQFPEEELAATVEVEVKVDGEVIDPSTYDSITGNVEVTYKIVNQTAREETIKYVDASGSPQELKSVVAIPFSVHIDVTYGAGWGNIYAPFANGGMSAGLTLSGDTSLGGSDTEGAMTLTARAEDASLPAAVISITPKDSSGSISTKESLADTGQGLDEALNGKAAPMLLDVQLGLGEAAVGIDKMLTEKLNPVLDGISELNLDADAINSKLAGAGDTIGDLGDALFGVNTALNQAGVLVVGLVDGIVSEESQAEMAKLSKDLGAIDKTLGKIIPPLEKASDALKNAGDALGDTPDELIQKESGNPDATLENAVREALRAQVGGPPALTKAMDVTNQLFIDSTGFALKCTRTGPPCLGEATVGEILDAMAVTKLSSTCTTGFETSNLWGTRQGLKQPYKDALQDGIDSNKTSDADKDILRSLQALLNNQEAELDSQGRLGKARCEKAAERTQKQLKNLFGNLATVGDGMDDLVPLLKTLQKSLAGASEGLAEFAASMPETRAELNRLAVQLAILAEANDEGAEVFRGTITDLFAGLEPVVTDLAQIVDLLAASGPDLKETLGLLPQLINDLAFGPTASFVSGLTSLGDMGAELSESASASVAVAVAVDELFQSGEGFPYGNAEGPTVSTTAVYTWELAGPPSESASTGTRAAYAIILLIIGAVGAVLMARRAG